MNQDVRTFTVEELGDLIRKCSDIPSVPRTPADPMTYACFLLEEAERRDRAGIPLPALPEPPSCIPEHNPCDESD